jgi:hypothetical protein
MEESFRNHEISNMLDLWEWCSRTLHVKWQRKEILRNDCLLAMAFALSNDKSPTLVSPITLPNTYQARPVPLFNKSALVRFWNVQPVTLLELCLGAYTKTSPLKERLNQIRLKWKDNPRLDEVAKKMRAREKRFRGDWEYEGHHPEAEFLLLEKETDPIFEAIGDVLFKDLATIDQLAREVLAQGPWQAGELPVSSRVRRTPEGLLNRTTRVKLWQAAHDVRILPLGEREALVKMYDALRAKITPAVKSAIEAQGYSVDQVMDDVINFDMHKNREDIA